MQSLGVIRHKQKVIVMTATSKGALYTRADVFIHNALDDEDIQKQLATRGLTSEALGEGSALLERSLDSNSAAEEQRGLQTSATAALTKAREEAHETYMQHVEAVRIALDGDDPNRAALGVDQARATGRFGDWIVQAFRFYDVAVKGKVAEYLDGIVSHDEFVEGREQIDAVLQLNRDQEAQKGIAARASRIARIDREALDAWLSKTIRIARLACADEPDVLEQLGVSSPG
jgi:hypothetical protein